MQIKDSAPYHRAITLGKSEKLDSRTIIAALVAHEEWSPDKAEQFVSDLFNALESQLLLERLLAA